ncbi:hypothetical protein [Streptomyces peucetius]
MAAAGVGQSRRKPVQDGGLEIGGDVGLYDFRQERATFGRGSGPRPGLPRRAVQATEPTPELLLSHER